MGKLPKQDYEIKEDVSIIFTEPVVFFERREPVQTMLSVKMNKERERIGRVWVDMELKGEIK